MNGLKVYSQEEATKNLNDLRLVTGIIITVSTKAEAFAGTDAQAYFKCGKLGKFFLNTIGEDDFEIGDTKSYSFECQFTLGSLRIAPIELGHDNTGKEPSWNVEKVSVQIRVNGSNQLFLYKQWDGIGCLDNTKAPYFTSSVELQVSDF